MFRRSGRLPHLLPPRAYSGSEHAPELERAFRDAWHVAASAEELPRDGSFVTTEVLGTPVLVWRGSKGPAAFVNVCAHRHAAVTARPAGCARELRCQYHGWTYDPQGYCTAIPEPEGLAPTHPKEFRLRPLRLERCGPLYFVSLAPSGPSLAEWLGACDLAGRLDPGLALVDAWSEAHACHWKVPIENSLESYHLPSVHPGSFGRPPPPADVEHELEPGFTRFRTEDRRRLNGALRRSPRHVYEHLHVFPVLTVVTSDLYATVQEVQPVGPRACRIRHRVFAHRGERALASALLRPFVRARVRRMARRIVAEDARLFPEVQRGLDHSPHAGVLSAREERVWAFQSWLRDRA